MGVLYLMWSKGETWEGFFFFLVFLLVASSAATSKGFRNILKHVHAILQVFRCCTWSQHHSLHSGTRCRTRRRTCIDPRSRISPRSWPSSWLNTCTSEPTRTSTWPLGHGVSSGSVVRLFLSFVFFSICWNKSHKHTCFGSWSVSIRTKVKTFWSTTMQPKTVVSLFIRLAAYVWANNC